MAMKKTRKTGKPTKTLRDPAKTRELVESAIRRSRDERRRDGTVELLHRALAELRGRRAAGFAVDERVLADLEKFCGDNPVEAKA